MLLTEFDEELYARTVKEEGIEEGIEKGENRISQLYLRLIADKRMEDLERAAADRTFRESLYKKYGL